MTLHTQVKKFIDSYKDVISDEEIMAVNRLNRNIGELGAADGYQSLITKKQKLEIQDYEFYSNIPAFIAMMRFPQTKTYVENITETTQFWAINFSVSLILNNREVTFRNCVGNLKIEPASELAHVLLQRIRLIPPDEQEANDIKISFVDAEDHLLWNKSIEDLANTEKKTYLFVRNFNRSSVSEEVTLLAKSKSDCLQSLTGWALLSK